MNNNPVVKPQQRPHRKLVTLCSVTSDGEAVPSNGITTLPCKQDLHL